MSLEQQFIAGLQLLLAVFLAAIVGLDRDRRHQPGLRTHILVGAGSCLFTLLSFHAFDDADPSRVAAQIVTGIGFIGAGTIMQLHRKHETDVKHLTTAASIWMTAAIGMAVGTGAWLLAIMATVVTWVVLVILRKIEPSKH